MKPGNIVYVELGHVWWSFVVHSQDQSRIGAWWTCQPYGKECALKWGSPLVLNEEWMITPEEYAKMLLMG